MTEVADLELCRELYDLSGWDDLLDWHSKNNGHYTRKGFVDELAPAYTTGYLLRKLPMRTENIYDTALLGRATNNNGWSVVYRDIVCLADTPENTLCKLMIELFKNGILTKGGEDESNL